MDSNQLFKYVYAKYGLKFEPIVPGSTDTYVLMSPVDSGYFAMLSRIRINGKSRAILDLKCGDFAGTIRDLPGFTDPVRVKDSAWVGAILEDKNDSAIKKTLDYAFKLAMNGQQVNVAQDQYFYIPPEDVEEKYKAQPIKPRKLVKKRTNSSVPEKIHQMIQLYDYSLLPQKGRSKNFYIQGRFMADYEDDYSEYFAFKRFYPTYHDMNVGQIRNYFTWRSKLRKGEYQKTSTSYAFVYIYELLNNITVDPKEGYQKLLDFKQNYVEKYDLVIEPYLNDWLKDYVLYYQLGEDAIEQQFKQEIKDDHDYLILRHPEEYSAEELAKVFAQKSSYWNTSKVIQKNRAEFAKILKCVWQELLNAKKYGIAYYSAFVAKPQIKKQDVFLGSVFYNRKMVLPVQKIDASRKYVFAPSSNAYWQIYFDDAVKKQKINLNTFLHELDRIVREKLKLGRPIKPRFIDQAVLKAIENGIVIYQKDQEKAKIDQIKIDFSDLEQIRTNASITRDSLLTDEEKKLEQEEIQKETKIEKETAEVKVDNEYGLDQDEMFLLLALLKKEPWQDYVKKKHLMVSILADSINDKLFDEFGDSVIEFDEQDQPQIIGDYEEDLKDMFLKG
ncbi:MAG: TerB N-terminal domain-containing protein [Lactobacillus sp.]